MNSRPKQLSFAISYGLAGGPAHSRRLYKLLVKAGFHRSNLENADIIIAHSAGCWLIPKTARPKIVVYVGMPLVATRPSYTWARANLNNYLHGHGLRTVDVSLKSIYYSARQPRRNRGIIQMAKAAQAVQFTKARSIFITNQHDPWPRGPLLKELITSQAWTFVSLSGSHDNIWEEPAKYVDIIKHYATELLAQAD